MIDITFLVYSSFSAFSITVGILFFNNIVAFVEIIFLCLLLGFGSPANTFLFNKSVLSKGYLVNNFVLCSDLSMYGLLAMSTYFVCGAQI